jgi:hypothetical protein
MKIKTSAQPVITTRDIKLADGTVVPANTETTAAISAGNSPKVAVKLNGKTVLVPVTAVRFFGDRRFL